MRQVTLSYNFRDAKGASGASSDTPAVAEALFLAHTLDENGDQPLGITEDGIYIYNTAELTTAVERVRQYISLGMEPEAAARRVATEDGHAADRPRDG